MLLIFELISFGIRHEKIRKFQATNSTTENQSDNERESALADSLQLDLFYVPKNCPEQMEQFAKHVWETGWKALPKHCLPHWLKDNDYIIKGYRPPLPSIRACFASIFRWHNETINIWTHGLGILKFHIES